MPDKKVIRITFCGNDYLIFLTEDSRVETCIHFQPGKAVGSVCLFCNLPFELRLHLEQLIFPNL